MTGSGQYRTRFERPYTMPRLIAGKRGALFGRQTIRNKGGGAAHIFAERPLRPGCRQNAGSCPVPVNTPVRYEPRPSLAEPGRPSSPKTIEALPPLMALAFAGRWGGAATTDRSAHEPRRWRSRPVMGGPRPPAGLACGPVPRWWAPEVQAAHQLQLRRSNHANRFNSCGLRPNRHPCPCASAHRSSGTPT